MKIVFKKDKSKTHVCFICNKQFNWDKNSLRWGKMEYETIQEKKEIDKVFCSKKCANKLKHKQ